MDTVRWAEEACAAGREAAQKGLSRDAHDYEPTSFALTFFQAGYDQESAKKETARLVRVLSGSAHP